MSGVKRIIIGWIAVALVAVIGLIAGSGYINASPLTDYAGAKVGHKSVSAVIFLSGDMGFIGMGGRLVSRLRSDNIPVVAINSLTFFRTQRTQAQVEALLATAMQHALAMDGGEPVTLIGQSFGADMLHVGLARMPSSLRRKVHAVALVVPSKTVRFRASPSGVFSQDSTEIDALPTASRLTWTRTICVHGQRETESLCPQLRQQNVVSYALPGGHLLGFRTDAVYALLHQANAIRPIA